MAQRRGDDVRTWRSILIGAAISAGVMGLALAGSVVAYFTVQHHDSEIVSTAVANVDRTRQMLKGQSFAEIRDGDDPIVHRHDPTGRHGAAEPPPHTLRVLVFESRSGKLVRINLPFRIVRLMHANGFTYLGELTFLEDTEFDSDRVRLTLDDLERLGRGIVVDHRHAGGAQFLAWVE